MKVNLKVKMFAVIMSLAMISMIFMISSCNGSPESSDDNSTAIDISKDREGNSITLPEKINKIISIGPSNTEILIALGLESKIIAADTDSENIAGLPSNIPMFSMSEPDGEQIVSLQPDIIFVTGMSKSGGIDPYKVIADTGICVVYIPSSTSIENIKNDIQYMANVMGVQSKGASIVTDMEKEIDAINKIGDTITDKKKVYFEISAAPDMYSLGKGTFINEMIELIGAVNILSNQESWIFVTDEAVVEANPDVILTSVNYIENPVDEIKSRPGWDLLTAVQNNDVFYIDSNASNRPNHNIIKALKEMAKAVYPDKYN